MREMTFDKFTAYDFDANYLERFKSSVKKNFLKKCILQDTYSKDYIKFISDPNNISVDLNIEYIYNISLQMHSLVFFFGYNYSFTYASSTGYSGSGTVDSSGNCEVNLKENTEYKTSTNTHKSKKFFYKSSMYGCEISLGNDMFDKSNLQRYKNVTTKKDLPRELSSLINKKWDYDEITPMLKQADVPKNVRQKYIDDALVYESTASRFTFEIVDGEIEKSVMTIFPQISNFNISVNYNGSLYEQKNLANSEDIVALGEESEHHKIFLAEAEKLQYDYNHIKDRFTLTGDIIYIVSIICAIALFIAYFWMVFLRLGGFLQFLQYFIVSLIDYFIILYICLWIQGFGANCNPDGVHIEDLSKYYDSNASLEELLDEVEIEILSLRKKHKKRAVIYRIISPFILLIFVLIAIFLANNPIYSIIIGLFD